MRILFLNAVGNLGGAERSLLDLLASLRQADPSLELHLAAPSPGPLATEAAGLNVATTAFALPASLETAGDSGLRERSGLRRVWGLMRHAPSRAWGAREAVRRLRSLILRLRPTLIHSNSAKFHLLAALARLPNRPIVWHLRDFVGQRPVLAPLLHLAASRITGAVAISEAVANEARKTLPRLPVHTVLNAIDTEHFSPGPGDGDVLDQLAGLPSAPAGTIRIGLIATYARWKGHDVFLEAAHLATQSPNRPLRFYVIGGPIYATPGSQWSEQELQALGAELRRRHLLGFVPFQSDPTPCYRALDVVVHASTRPEPFGRTIAEAMACGKTVLVSGKGGAAELFTHGHDAWGIPENNPRVLAQTLLQLATDPQRCQTLGQAARSTALERFGRARLGPQVLEAYAQMGIRF